MWAVGGTIHSVLSGAGDLDQKIVESIGDASFSVFAQFFQGFLDAIGGTVKWMCILIFIIVIIFIIY